MTNCPNCGAPYKLHSRVCEYCGSVREQSKDDNIPANDGRDGVILIDMCSSLDKMGGIIKPYIYSKRTGAYIRGVTPDPSQQTACGAQATANAASGMTCSLEQMRLNAEQARINAAQAQFDAAQWRQTVQIQKTMQAAKNDIMRHSKKRFGYFCTFCILTFLLPIGIPICFALAMKEAILAKVLGRILIPCWFCIGYIISLRGMKL